MEWKSYGRSIIKGAIFAIVVTLLFTAILSLIMCFVDISDSIFNFLYVVLSCIALVFGSIMGAKINGSKGWLIGGVVGIFYYILMMGTTIILGGELVFEVSKFIICIIIGLLSGMLGINLGSD